MVGTKGKDPKSTREAILEITMIITQKERHLWFIPTRTKQRSSIIIMAKMVTFFRKCNEPKKVQTFEMLSRVSYVSESALYVSSSVYLTESHSLWTVDSSAIDHVAKDRDVFVEFRQIPYGSKWLYMENNSKVEVKGVGTCKLSMRGGRTLILHDVLFAPDI